MRLLLDSNVVIPLEDATRALQPHFARLNELVTAHGHQMLVHPAAKTDISRDRNEERRVVTLSRLARYPLLEAPPRFDPDVAIDQLDNDGVDRELLYCLERDAVSILVTEDRGIHRKAISLGVGLRILYVQQAVSWLERLHSRRDVSFPNIKDVPIYTFRLDDTFFDSLRAGYAGFDAWFRAAARSGRRAWAYVTSDSAPRAICIYKREKDPTITDAGLILNGEVLKLCTFKVGEEVRGRRVGELFIKAAFKYCWDNAIDYTYLTMLPEQMFLRDLCLKYGFSEAGLCSGGKEIALVKEFPRFPPFSAVPPLEYHIRYSPCIKIGPSVQQLLVPIQPRYHVRLFPEIEPQIGLFTDPVFGNGLTLAYLCNSRLKVINPGDVLLFYRSDDLRAITTIAVVEHAFVSSDPEEISRHVAKRTVYGLEEISSLASKPVRVVLFRLAVHLEQKVDYQTLKGLGIVTGPIQTITRISVDEFRSLTQVCGLQSCLFAN